jgi:hypothetical protein
MASFNFLAAALQFDLQCQVDQNTNQFQIDTSNTEVNSETLHIAHDNELEITQIQTILRKTENGRLYLRPAFGRTWYIQLEDIESVIWTKVGAFNYCSHCAFKCINSRVRQEYHESAHRGGTKCLNCEWISFSDGPHVCKPPAPVYVLSDDKEIIREVFGRPTCNVFGLPLMCGAQRILWIGTGDCETAPQCALQRLTECENAKNNNYKHQYIQRKGKSAGCTSLCKLIYPKPGDPKYEPLPDEAFFFPHGGSYAAMQHYKNFIRGALDTKGHDRSRASEFFFKPFAGEVFLRLLAMDEIPIHHKDSLITFQTNYWIEHFSNLR